MYAGPPRRQQVRRPRKQTIAIGLCFGAMLSGQVYFLMQELAVRLWL